jgi:GTP-binding protein
MEFRNIAIIAHVDHGKTTLVDGLLRQCHAFQAHETMTDRVMDSMDLERERGITISAKNTAVFYEGVKINILDTPGHADFSGEVERVLTMVEGVLLLVDASEGPLPGTRFVLRKAMESHLTPIVCINKIDRPDARINEVVQAVYDLFIDLGADEHQLDFPVLYAVARNGVAHLTLGDGSTDLRPLLDVILKTIPPPPAPEAGASAQMLITNLDYDPYVGRLGIGRLFGSTLKKNEQATWHHAGGDQNVRLQWLYTWRGLKRHEVTEAEPGDIVGVAGVDDLTVGDSLSAGVVRNALPRVKVDEPTIGMVFSANTSPLAGRDGKLLTSRQIKERLDREMLSNVSLRLEDTGSKEAFKVIGRGELQLGILIEQMRREGFELTVSRPEVVRKEEGGKMLEPWEIVTIDLPDAGVGGVTQMLAARKGTMLDLQSDGSGRSTLVYRVPSRGLIGFRNQLLTESRGEGVIHRTFDGWAEDAGYIQGRLNGALVNDRTGRSTAYALYALQERGRMFIPDQVDVYEGMIIGLHARENDLNVNATKEKQLNNIRTHAADEKLVLIPPIQLSLENAIEFIDEDERVEITPTAIRLRKAILEVNKRSIIRGERRQEA